MSIYLTHITRYVLHLHYTVSPRFTSKHTTLPHTTLPTLTASRTSTYSLLTHYTLSRTHSSGGV